MHKPETLWLPLGNKKFLTSNAVNQRGRWARAQNTQQWRDHAALAAQTKILTRSLNYSVVDVYIWKPTKVRYDPSNLAPVAKAVIDGMVQTGVFPDDNWKHIDGPHLHHGGFSKTNPGILIAIRPASRIETNQKPWEEPNA